MIVLFIVLALFIVAVLLMAQNYVKSVEEENAYLRMVIRNQRKVFEGQLARAEIMIQALRAKIER